MDMVEPGACTTWTLTVAAANACPDEAGAGGTFTSIDVEVTATGVTFSCKLLLEKRTIALAGSKPEPEMVRSENGIAEFALREEITGVDGVGVGVAVAVAVLIGVDFGVLVGFGLFVGLGVLVGFGVLVGLGVLVGFAVLVGLGVALAATSVGADDCATTKPERNRPARRITAMTRTVRFTIFPAIDVVFSRISALTLRL
ncbi:MAG: hypothetical protein ACLQDV_23485 [Candidatus Binataceae bacterium]